MATSALIGALGCGPSVTTRTALYGDLATLKKEIAAAQERHELDRDATLALARAVARREVRSARGEAAARRIAQVRSCVEPVKAELEEQSREPGDTGALATLALLMAGHGDVERYFDEYSQHDAGAWRAVAARSAIRPRHGAARRKMMTDGDERVRLAAFQAALTARDVDDVPELLEAARLDPSPLNRSTAAQAAGALGGERVVLALRDRYDSGGEDDQMVVIDAWAQPAAFASGGERELVRVAETAGGLRSLAAARFLESGNDESKQLARGVFSRAIAEGTREERRMAIRTVSVVDDEIAHRIHEAAKDADPEVLVMALARLVSLPKYREDAVKRLQEISKKKANVGLQAASALAAANDRSVQPKLVEALGAQGAFERRVAAVGLVRLGDFSAAATALGDDSPSVRTSIACHMLTSL